MEENLIIQDSVENFTTWLQKPFLSEMQRKLLKDVSVLLVPTIGFREENKPTFPIHTEDILQFLKQNVPNDVLVDICIDDEQYSELALHSDYKRIGNLVVKAIVAPLVVGILLNYITENYIKKDESKPQINIVNVDNSVHNTNITNQPAPVHTKKHLEPTKVKFSITVVKADGSSKDVHYEGAARDAGVVAEGIKKIIDDDTITSRK